MQIVSDVMTRDVRHVSPRETLRRAAQLMDELDVGALPVCEGERLVGIVTDRDITVRATSAGLRPDDTVIDDVMSTDVRWCFEDQPLDEVMQQMGDTQIRRVPVVSHDEDHRLLGIVSLADLATKQGAGADRVLEEVSFPAEPDHSGGTAGADGDASEVRASRTGTASGLAGSDFLDVRMNEAVEEISNADPSDVVEVSPEDLVNRNAPGSTDLRSTVGMANPGQGQPEVRRVSRKRADSSTGESGAPGGTDAAGASGASSA
ncbi:CBS domain-containing protein [Noviherbaspirillum galbum]|uniref:CBS domain-containing protein n=1 Tax=Noviherbaspirillum galbum TaxID=2709383 RepID=A0A6B3SJQ8_9BURK|nr:CBS domain-containing protein [Noviherbaspirillum galbum]NEX59585.1 CBS domain-containing protein [Noviherbaspirillum galbum]